MQAWDVALTARRPRAVPSWVTVRAEDERDAQVAAVMWGCRQDPTVAWAPGRVRPSREGAARQAAAPSYGGGLVARLAEAIAAGRLHVVTIEMHEGTAMEPATWYAMGPDPR